MLQTLLKIGEWQSHGKSEWDRFLEFPKADKKDKRGNSQKNYTLLIIFDLDKEEAVFHSGNLKEFEVKDVEESLGIKMKGSNSKAICAAGISKRLGRIYQAFFGKEEESESGQLKEAVELLDVKLLENNFGKIIDGIFKLKNSFLEKTTYETPSKSEVDIRALNDKFELNKNENIVFLSVAVKAEKFGYDEPILFSKIPEYKKFLKLSYFGQEKEKNTTQSKQKLCYASGEMQDEVKELKLSNRYSLNKMFVTETKNYASVFDKKNFKLNYQVSAENQNKLDYASEFLLRQGFKITIANIDHVIVPQFLQTSKVDLESALDGIHRKSDILFSLNKLKDVSENIMSEFKEDEIFWLNFIAFESDGKFFKSTELIKDVSSFYFNKLVEKFVDIDWEFRDANFVDWNSVMMEYDYDSKQQVYRHFNFNSLYKIIPLRKDKEKKNKALELFKTILENRNVNKDLLYDYFVELMLCHYYERYGSYTNVQKNSKDYFSFTVRNSVFKYHAFIQLLNKLNLIDMEEPDKTSEENSKNDYEDNILNFFNEMKFTKEQKAMFYLGRMLNRVEYIQKGKNKTVIQKVNFNGMDKDDIQRLRLGLMEKAKQYNAMGKVIFTDNKFGEHFNFNQWDLNPKEAVFFLLTGYSFGIGVKDAEALEENETETTI